MDTGVANSGQNEGEREPQKYKRKREKSVLRNARKYEKKGCFGRGVQLEPETYHYLVKILETYREGFDDPDAQSAFVNNALEQSLGQEINVSCNQVGCRVLDTLLPLANDVILERYLKAFGEDLRPLCSDRFASHVLDALIVESARRSLLVKKENSETQEKCRNFLIKISKFLLNNLEDFIWDTYGNQVIRTCLENLAQIPTEKKIKHADKYKSSGVKKEVPVTELPSEYLEIVRDYGERLIHWPQFSDLCTAELTSGFLQVLLVTLKKVDKKLLKKYLKKLVDENFAPDANQTVDNQTLPAVFLSKSLIMLLETALQVASSKLYTQIYAKCFVGRVAKLAVIRNTNFAVQKLLSNCREKVEFEASFEELQDCFKEIIEAGHTGILLSLGQGCQKFATKQGSFVQNLMNALDCFQPEERQNHFVSCLAKFCTYDTLQKQTTDLQKDRLNLHGTLILQLILEFNKPIKIINSILSMEVKDLKSLFTNTQGSHIVDSYVKSAFVGEKSREKLLRKMRGTYQELASSKYGSRSFEAIWNVASLKNKLAIMEELVHKDASWSTTEYGKIIAGKINLPLYKRNKENWKNSKDGNKVEKLFADIIN